MWICPFDRETASGEMMKKLRKKKRRRRRGKGLGQAKGGGTAKGGAEECGEMKTEREGEILKEWKN